MTEKILIIDDDTDTLELVSLVLQKQGYRIVTASNGKQGLRKMSRETPDLILLDVMMPDMDGYEVARRLREDPQTAKVPVLMFTAKSQLHDKEVGFQSGADAYLTKPTHPEELQAHIKELLARTENAEMQQVTPALETTKTSQQTTPVYVNSEVKTPLSKAQRKKTVGVISDRFSDWFTSIPDTETDD